MKLGIGINFNHYHEVYKNNKDTYVTKCGSDLKYLRKNEYGIYGMTENWIYPNCIKSDNAKKLTKNGLCKNCIKLYKESFKGEINFTLIKYKLGIK